MLLAPGSFSEEESLGGRDEEAICIKVELLARALKALVDCWILSAYCWGESADKLINELPKLDEDESSDGMWVAKLLGFSES